MSSSSSSNPTRSPRRHLVQALTLVNDIINRRNRDGSSLSDEELELLSKAYKNAPKPNNQQQQQTLSSSPLAGIPDMNNNNLMATPLGNNNKSSTDNNNTGTSPHQQQQIGNNNQLSQSQSQQRNRGISTSKRQTAKQQVSELLASSSEDTSKLVNFAVSCSELTTSPVQLIQLLVDFVRQFVPAGKPVSMMIFDGEYTVDPINGTLLANSERFLGMFSSSSSADHNSPNNNNNNGSASIDLVFDATAAAYFLPVQAEGELFGFVQISNMHSEGELEESHIKLLSASTCVAALALRTSWQLEDLEWSHRKQAMLLKVGTSLTSDAFSKEQDVISRIQSRAKDLGDAHAAYYFRVDEESREIEYFNNGKLISESIVFGHDESNDGTNSENGGDEDHDHSHNHNHSVKSSSHKKLPYDNHDRDDDLDDDNENSISDAVRLAMQTADRVVKTASVVQLQQAQGDDDRYVDVVGTRSRYAGAKKMSSPGNNNNRGTESSSTSPSRGFSGGGISLRRGARAVNVDLPFSLIKTRSVRSVLGVPIINEENQVKGVLVLTNKNHRRVARIDVPQVFEQRDVEIILALASVASISIANCKAANRIKEEKKRRDAILQVVAHLNETDIRRVDEICKYVMHGARKLVNADRSTLFLIDEERDELYSAVADSVGKVIRFPVGKGISGRVALTGQAEIIRDAYADDRFNKEVDKETGYRTLSILTVPVQSKRNTLAVAQLVNKMDPKTNEPVPFTQEDLEMLRTFSLFAGIAISNSQLLEFTVKAGQEAMALTSFDDGPNGLRRMASIGAGGSMQVAPQGLPVVSSSEIELVRDALDIVTRLRDSDPSRFDPTSRTFDLFALREEAPDGDAARDYASAVVVFLMTTAGFDKVFKFDSDTLITFVIQCRSMYRLVPYHSYFHAVDVVQTIYTFLYAGGARTFISELESFVLLVTALCHDLDHVGLNNNFHLKSDSPLGILSSVSGNGSVLEVHHCNLAIQILSSPDSNIFIGLSKSEQTTAFREMLSCILATDMAKHGDSLKHFEEIAPHFDKENDEHRLVAMQMMMKAADISNVTKPFHISRQWATAVTEEFYQQGDKERARGMQVLPMNDRQLGTELAKGQLGFINFVAKRFFNTIQSLLFKDMDFTVTAVKENVEKWQEVLDQHQEEEDNHRK